MAETLGLSSPVPSTMNNSPTKKALVGRKTDNAIDRCPSAIKTPPHQIDRCNPSQRSAIQPPGNAVMYTDDAYSPTMAEATVRSKPRPPLSSAAVMNRMSSGRMP